MFQYTKLKTVHKGLKAAIASANLLARCLRFNYIEINNMMSARCNNESLECSEVFLDGSSFEMQERF